MSIREELELDISSGISAISQLAAELDQAAKTFKVALADAISVLSGVTVDVDTSNVSGEVQSAFDNLDAAQVPVEADTTPAEGEIADVDNNVQPVDVPVVADTADAEAAIADVSAKASEAASGQGRLVDSTTAFGAAAGTASGSAEGLLSIIEGIGPGGVAAAAGITALVATTTQLFTSAVNSEGVMEAFTRATGGLGEQVRNLQIGQLNIDLGELAQNLGSDDEQAFSVTQKIIALGKASGATGGDIVKTSQQILILAANARATNPALGSLGDIANSLQTALARGGRFAANFGLSLNSAEINARALRDTGKQNAAELTQWEKAAAGAAIATEQLGNGIDKNIAAASENAIINLDRLKQVFDNTLETLGTPLISPVLNLLESAIGPATDLVGVLGDAAGAVIPLLTGILQGLVPITSGIKSGLSPALKELGPAFGALGEAIGKILEGAAPLIAAVAELVGLFGSGLATTVQLVADVLGALGPVITGVIFGFAALKLGLLALEANPVILLATAVVTLVGAMKGLNQETDKFAQFNQDVSSQADAFQQAFLGEAATLKDLTEQYNQSTATFSEFIAKRSEFSKDQGILDSLRRTGVGMSDLRGQLSDTKTGLQEFVAQAVAAGEVKIKIDGVEQTADDIRNLSDVQGTLFAKNGKVITQGKDLVSAFNKQQAAQEEAAKSTVNSLILTGQITQAQFDQVAATLEATNGYSSYQQVLNTLTFGQGQLANAIQATNFPLQQNAGFWLSLAQAVVQGDVTSQNMGQTLVGVADKLGITDEQLKQYVQSIEDGVTNIATAMTQNIPPASAALQGLGDAADPTKLQTNLFLQTLSIAKFKDNLKILLEQGNTDLVQFLAEQGPQVTATWAQAIVNGGPEVAAAVNEQLGAYKQTTDDLTSFLTNEAAPQIAGQNGAIAGLAKDATNSLGLNLDFTNAASQPIADLNSYFASNPAGQSAGLAGTSAGADFASGMATGITNNTASVTNAVRQLVQDTEAAARDEADSNSPSLLFAALGNDLAAGIKVGFDEGAPAVAASVRDLVSTSANLTVAVPTASAGAPAPGTAPAAVTGVGGAPLVGEITINEVAGPKETTNDVINKLRAVQYRQTV